MKPTHALYLLAASLLLFSCEKPGPMEEGLTGEVILSVDLGPEATKAGNYTTELASERAVQSVEYFLFDSQGRLEAMISTTGTSSVRTTVRTGSKTVWAVVNLPSSRFSDVKTLSQFEAKEVSFADFGASRFPMSGKKAGVSVSTGAVSVSIPVERFVSRICVAQVTNRLNGSLSGETINITNIFLENVVGNSRVTGTTPSSLLWYNQCGRKSTDRSKFIASPSDADYPAFTFDGSSGATVGYGSTSDLYSCLYMFPNSATGTACGWTGTFTPRYTRIVIEASILGERYYYPLNLADVRRNNAYTLYLTITHPGSRDPDTFDFVTDQDVVITIGGFDDFDDDFVITY